DLVGILRRREVAGEGATRHVSVPPAVHDDRAAEVVAGAGEIGGVDEGGAVGIEHRHEGVIEALVALEALHRWEVGGAGETRYVGVARAVYGDAPAFVVK